MELITSIELLLQLDIEYPADLMSEDSVKFMVDCAQGFDSLSTLQQYPNQDIQKAVTDLLTTHYVPYSGDDTNEFLQTESEVN